MGNKIAKLVPVLLLTAYFLLPTTTSAATYPLKGYAWSENIGWVSFNGPGYGVIVDSANGSVTGYAWSEYYGWLSFTTGDLAGCPSGTCSAHFDAQTGDMTGWAKFLSTGEWIHLAGSGYGVTYSQQTNKFSSYAWGDTFTGWLKWSNNNPAYSVYTDDPIQAPPEAPTLLTATAVSKTQINLTWQDNSSGELHFVIERKTGTGDWTVIYTTNPNVESYSDVTGLSCGMTYSYRVKAVNGGGENYSTEATGNTSPCTASIIVDATPNTATWSVNPGSISRTGDATATVNPASGGTAFTFTEGATPAGYDPNPTITITELPNCASPCRSVTLFEGGTAHVVVTYAKSFNYTLSNGSLSYNPISVGNNTEYSSITITRTLTADSGAPKDVSLSLSGVPAGVSATFAPSSGVIAASQSPASLTINFTIPGGTAPANQTVTVTGSPLGKTTSFNMTIEESPDLNVVCVPSPTSAQVGQTVTWTANVSNGTPPYVSYLWQGDNIPTDPAPATPSYSLSYSTTGSKKAWVTVHDSKGKVGVCNQASVSISVNPSFKEF